MLSVNLALDRRVYIAVDAVDAADVIAAVYPQRKLLCLQQTGETIDAKVPFSGNEAKIYSLSPSGMTQKRRFSCTAEEFISKQSPAKRL